MWLTRALLYYKHRMRVRGLLFEGKNKIVPLLTVDAKRRAVNRLLREQDNLEILNNPYITAEEDHGHTGDKKLQHFRAMCAEKQLKMLPHRELATELNHLNVTQKWE